MFFNHIEQTIPDDSCEKYGLQYGFYQFESKIADAILRSKVMKKKKKNSSIHYVFHCCKI